MKKNILIAAAVTSLLALSACGDSDAAVAANSTATSTAALAASEVTSVQTSFEQANNDAISAIQLCSQEDENACEKIDAALAKLQAYKNDETPFCVIEASAHASYSVPCSYEETYVEVLTEARILTDFEEVVTEQDVAPDGPPEYIEAQQESDFTGRVICVARGSNGAGAWNAHREGGIACERAYKACVADNNNRQCEYTWFREHKLNWSWTQR
jgi:hypothetical protein